MSEFLAELLGTMVLVTFGVGVVGGVLLKWSKAEEAGWIVITVGWGLAVTMGIFVSGTVSDAHLNPAVTLGFASIGDFPWSKVPAYISGQMIGALIGVGTNMKNGATQAHGSYRCEIQLILDVVGTEGHVRCL